LRLGDLPSTNAFYFPGYHIVTMAEYPPSFYIRTSPAQFAQALSEKGIQTVLFEKSYFDKDSNGFWRYRDLSSLGICLPPFGGPSFLILHETPEAVLYRVNYP
jgi:hypothetical protein